MGFLLHMSGSKSIIQLTLNFPSFIRDENKLDDLA